MVGSTGFVGVTCVDWFSEPAPNAADFDVVVVNGLSLEQIVQLGDKENGKPFSQIKLWQTWLNGLKDGLKELLKSDGLILGIVGKRVGSVGFKDSMPVKGWPVLVSTWDWIPLPTDLKEEEGETVLLQDASFERYFKSVRRWDFTFIDTGVDQDEEIPDWYIFQVPIATNRAGGVLGVKFSYTLPRVKVGHLILLPPPTHASPTEAVRVILEDICGVSAGQAAPDWAAAIGMPGTDDLDKTIEGHRKAVEDSQAKMAPLIAERRRRANFKAILYETGIERLQDVVEAVFRELGLTTKPSKVSDEFIVEHEGLEILVEVKGHGSSAALTDLRQLIDYQLEHEQKSGSPIKSALIVNAWRSLPLEERGRPEKRGQKGTIVFPDNVLRRATANNIALLDTVELYKALNAFWLGQINGAKVFDALTSASGVVTLME